MYTPYAGAAGMLLHINVSSQLTLIYVLLPSLYLAMPNVTKILKTHVDRYNKVKKKIPYSQEKFTNIIGKSYKQRQSR
jgi:hypothetical protein